MNRKQMLAIAEPFVQALRSEFDVLKDYPDRLMVEYRVIQKVIVIAFNTLVITERCMQKLMGLRACSFIQDSPAFTFSVVPYGSTYVKVEILVAPNIS